MGGNRQFIFNKTGYYIEPLVHPIASMKEMDEWSTKYIGNRFNSSQQRKLLIEATFVLLFFILDIDNFKTVNDTYGHAAGDLVIADFASRLSQQFREGDIVGRIGGDEFGVFMPVPSKYQAAEKALYHTKRNGKHRYTLYQAT